MTDGFTVDHIRYLANAYNHERTYIIHRLVSWTWEDECKVKTDYLVFSIRMTNLRLSFSAIFQISKIFN